MNQALSCFLPLVFLLCSILRPLFVRMRLRNPCLRMRISRDGRFMFMYRRGPHRICEPAPASPGCDVIAVLGTTSAIPDPIAASAAACVGMKVPVGARDPAAGLLVKMLGCAEMPGRRIGKEEKVLIIFSRYVSQRFHAGVWAGQRRADLVKAGCLVTSRTAARSADWAKSRDMATVLQRAGVTEED
jgi:hypothetical protein